MSSLHIHEQFGPPHVGCEPSAAYFVPYKHFEEAFAAAKAISAQDQDERYLSSRVHFLNGCYDFQYFESYVDVPEDVLSEFYQGDFKPIQVPSVWQNAGYDRHGYTNVNYPFPYDPPHVPHDNPCGLYRRHFKYTQNPEAKRVTLHFEGVDCCYYLALNGYYLGYSEVSHSTSVFDITEALREGDNVLSVLVLKWGVASYLEDQDKFRMSGIFRDVYWMERPDHAIADFFVHADYDAKLAQAALSLDVTEREGCSCPLRFHFYDAAFNHLGTCEQVKDLEQVCANIKVQPWSPESPYLYHLFIETECECIWEEVGFRRIERKGRDLFINGQRPLFRGVNRHDSDPVTGFSITREQLKTDLYLMKLHNVNAIRTSHYPNAPFAYRLYDRLGFFVIDEADMECHGVLSMFGADFYQRHVGNHVYETKAYCHLAMDERFDERILDRNQRCVQRDKNRPCVIMWSMGNESGYGPSFEAAARWIKSFDPSRLLHYEGSNFQAPNRTNDLECIDVHSSMYTSVDGFEEFFERGELLDKPVMLCEYAHAMGNGPGGLEDYRSFFEKHEHVVGGFIWEWCDHALDMGKTETGRRRYFYGGDFGEFPHDGNFCVDGLVTPDRRAKTGLREFRNIYRPLRLTEESDLRVGRLVLEHCWEMEDLNPNIAIFLQLLAHGEPIFEDLLELPRLMPRSRAELHFDASAIRSFIEENEKDLIQVELTYVLLCPKDQKDCAGNRWYQWLNQEMWEAEKEGKLLYPTLIPEHIYRDAPDLYESVKAYIEETEMDCLSPHILGYECVTLSEPDEKGQKDLLLLDARVGLEGAHLSVQEDERRYLIQGSKFSLSFSKLDGSISSYVVAGEEVLEKPSTFDVWRAPTDNDRNIRHRWQAAGYDREIARVISHLISEQDDRIRLDFLIHLAPISMAPTLEIKLSYEINLQGEIEIELEAERLTQYPWIQHDEQTDQWSEGFPFLPRFGLCLRFKAETEQMRWLGYGPEESYVDRLGAARFGLHEENIDAHFVDHIKPQESGSHYGVKGLSLSKKTGPYLYIESLGEPISVSASRYSAQQLTQKQHNTELEVEPLVYVHLDAVMSGIGSASCGPNLPRQYQARAATYALKLRICPIHS